MADKSSFTPDEWKLLLESVMMASIAITAAEPHGLWGLLQESFAGGAELAKAKMDPGADALVKAVVADFGTADGRSIARDGLKEKLTDSNQQKSRPSASTLCDRLPRYSTLRLPPTQLLLRLGCDRSASTLPRLPKRVVF